MTDNVKHSTSYFHEVLAKAFEMFKNGYEPVMETPFQPRRQGSAFVTEYKLVREPLDGVVNFDIDKMDQALKSDRIQVPDDLNMEDFDEFMKQCEPLPAELLDRMTKLREKAESNRALEELTQQAQELDMGYDKQLSIQEKWEMDDEINFEGDEQKKLAESEDSGKMFYTKQELDAMEWQEFKKLIDEAGIRGRRRQNLTRDYLKYQEEEK